ncbi:hypothetical protein [Aridibaculum aurantiacum]|uniref:hypothetical protein n=1 Tax=Aridibaculum aurantiacum TaxID=2810307 RepID=UPI001A96296D|nr:hypothetical protein [Aridibaculum aurantiacum]
MRNILIFAGIAGLAAAVAIYFVTEADKNEADYIEDAAVDAYDTMNENIGRVERRVRKGFNAMS